MKKHLILIAPLLFLLSGCAIFSSSITFTPVDGLKEMKLSSCTIPAKISKESDKTLEAQGYAYIGFSRSEDVVKTCWEDDCRNFTCSDKLPHRDTTKEVLDEAAAHGGDVVILQKDATLSTDSTTKQGKCIGWRDRDIQVSYCCEHRSGYCQRTCFRTQTVRDCTNHENIYGKKCSFITSGTVWRHDPELIKYTQQIKEYDRLKEIYSKDYFDKYKPYEVKFPEAVRVDTKYGFKDKSGKIVISPQFNSHDYWGWSEGLQAVARDWKWGFINKTGKWVIQPSYDVRPGRFKEGLASVSVDKKWGFINKEGIYIIKPRFTKAGDFSEGLAAIAVDDKWGYTDKQGNIVIEPQFRNAVAFSEGYAAIAVGDKKWGYIDKRGNLIITPQFDYAEAFVKGIAKVVISGRWGFINKAGERLAKGFDPF